MQRDFKKVIEEIRNSEDQQSLQKREMKFRKKAFLAVLSFTIFLMLFIICLLFFDYGWILLGSVVMVAISYIAWDQYTVKTILIAKEQDRKFFLQCIRKAENIEELNDAGFFAYFTESYGKTWLREVRHHQKKMRHALDSDLDFFDRE